MIMSAMMRALDGKERLACRRCNALKRSSLEDAPSAGTTSSPLCVAGSGDGSAVDMVAVGEAAAGGQVAIHHYFIKWGSKLI